jgi:hypothetical protein
MLKSHDETLQGRFVFINSIRGVILIGDILMKVVETCHLHNDLGAIKWNDKFDQSDS